MNEPTQANADRTAATSRLAWLDRWMALHPFHPRLIPLVVYVAALQGATLLQPAVPGGHAIAYTAGCALIAWMLWRYRALMPEMTFRFHWGALVVGFAGAAAWMGLAVGMERLAPGWFEHRPTPFFETMAAPVAWYVMIARLVGMAALVPIVEELVFRSALLRCLRRPRPAWVFLVQTAEDLPLVGNWVMNTETSKRYIPERRPLADAFEQTPLGVVTGFSIVASLVLWCLLSHLPRDWPGTIVYGLLCIGLVWWTNRPGADPDKKLGLGPVIWAHAITNAILWAYTLASGDWRFL